MKEMDIKPGIATGMDTCLWNMAIKQDPNRDALTTVKMILAVTYDRAPMISPRVIIYGQIQDALRLMER